jgi:hypothetical protein
VGEAAIFVIKAIVNEKFVIKLFSLVSVQNVLRIITADAADWIRKYFIIPMVSFFEVLLFFLVCKAVNLIMLISNKAQIKSHETLIKLIIGVIRTISQVT